MESKYVIFCIVALIAAIALFLFGRQKRNPKPMTRQQLGDPEGLLKEVEVYIAYDLRSKAIDLLKQGNNAYPENQKIRRKLAELTK